MAIELLASTSSFAFILPHFAGYNAISFVDHETLST
jgi:hypothetical protein